MSLTSLYLQMQITPRNVRGIERFEYKYIKNRTYFDQRQIHIKLSPEGYIFIRAFDKFDHVGFGAFGAYRGGSAKGTLRSRRSSLDRQYKKVAIFSSMGV